MSTQASRLVTSRRIGYVGEIILNRAEQLNAISSAMAVELASVARGFAADDEIRAIVISSSSVRAFCVGADLKERQQFSLEQLLAQRPVLSTAFRSVFDLPVAVVAAVNGFALGGGFEIALSCDLIVADDSAQLGLPEVSRGLLPGGGGTQLLARRAGPAVAADVILTGRHIEVEEALRLGIIDRRVETGQARQEALRLAEQIAKNSPVATRLAKAAIRRGAGVPIGDGFVVEEQAWQEVVRSPDRNEGISAFVEKRPPVWPKRTGG